MKKVFTLILAAALVLSIGAASAFAEPAAVTGANYVDADGDGVCDNCPDGGLCLRDGTGRHAGHGSGHGNCGANFVDADDGVCDSLGSRTMDGTGFGHRCGRNK